MSSLLPDRQNMNEGTGSDYVARDTSTTFQKHYWWGSQIYAAERITSPSKDYASAKASLVPPWKNNSKPLTYNQYMPKL